MAIDSMGPESPSSPSSHIPSHSTSQSRHFYLAVDRLPYKMDTLVDLLGVVGRKSGLPMVVCCSSRDELDNVCSTVSSLPYISLSSLSSSGNNKSTTSLPKCLTGPAHSKYSDLGEAERALVLERIRHAAFEWQQSSFHSGNEVESGEHGSKSHMVVVTDACLPLIAAGESPLPARFLINYELPTKKEIYMRRMAACLAPDGIVINMVVGGEVVTLKSIEESSNIVVAEMPIQVSEIL